MKNGKYILLIYFILFSFSVCCSGVLKQKSLQHTM